MWIITSWRERKGDEKPRGHARVRMNETGDYTLDLSETLVPAHDDYSELTTGEKFTIGGLTRDELLRVADEIRAGVEALDSKLHPGYGPGVPVPEARSYPPRRSIA